MKRALLIALTAVLLSGCTTTSGRSSRLWPWNWFAPDHATQLQGAQQDTQEIEDKISKRVQIEVAKVLEALKSAPQENRAVKVATRAAENAQNMLNQAAGPISAEDLAALKETVQNLLSENAELRATGERQQAAAEVINTSLSGALDDSRSREKEMTEKLQQSDLRYQAEAEKSRRLVFWGCVIVGGWILLQLLAGVSRFFPQLAPVAQLAGMVSAPVVQSLYNRATTAVGQAIASAEKVSTATADVLRVHLDGPLDEADKIVVRKNYESAART